MRLKGESPTTWKWMEFSGSFQELYGEIIENDKAWIDFIETSGDAFYRPNSGTSRWTVRSITTWSPKPCCIA